MLALPAGWAGPSSSRTFKERLDHAMRRKAAVVIDLSRLRFIDSAGLDLLVRAERQLRDSGVQLVLVRGPQAVHRRFALTSLDSHFEFCDCRVAGGNFTRRPPRIRT
jgi:anti-anti-sigma factor